MALGRVVLYAWCSLSLSSCRFAYLILTHTVKYIRGVRKFLLGIFYRECVKLVSSFVYLAYFLRNIRSCMCWTGPFNFR